MINKHGRNDRETMDILFDILSSPESAYELPSQQASVAVNADFTPNGEMIPRFFVREDGKTCMIDEIEDVCVVLGEMSSGVVIRFTVFVNGIKDYLYFEQNGCANHAHVGRWFVAGK